MFSIVTVVKVYMLLLRQCYVCMFCIVTVLRVRVLYCESGTWACFVL
jgi:hypothetical protein